MFHLMQGLSNPDDPGSLHFPELREYNIKLIREALTKPLVDYVKQEHPEMAP